MSTGTQTLAERITSVLVAAGFRKYPADSAYDGSFVVTEGVGATVGIAWEAAEDRERATLLMQYENALLRAGLGVASRGNHLYVADPGDRHQRISDALLNASFSDWDVGEGTVIELPLDVAVKAVMAVMPVGES